MLGLESASGVSFWCHSPHTSIRTPRLLHVMFQTSRMRNELAERFAGRKVYFTILFSCTFCTVAFSPKLKCRRPSATALLSMLLYWRSRGFVQGMSRAATSEQPSCSPSWTCSLDMRNNKLFLCLCLTMLSLSVVVWVATTPVSTALPLFVRDVEYRPPTRNDRTKLFVPARELGSDYSLPDKLSLPFRRYIKSGEELRSVEWVTTMHEYLLTLNKECQSSLEHGVWGLHTQKVDSQLAIWCNCCPRPTTAQCVGVLSRSKTVRRRVESDEHCTCYMHHCSGGDNNRI